MSYVAIDAHRRRIDKVVAHATSLDPGDQIRGDLARYICVLVSGYIEQTVKSLVLVHCANRGVASTVERYVAAQLKRHFQSADTERILQLINLLDPAYEESFRARLSKPQEEAINSVVRLRHQFAHGGEAGTSVAQQQTYRTLIEAALLDLRMILA